LEQRHAETRSSVLLSHPWQGVVHLARAPEGAVASGDWEESLYQACREVLELVQMMDRGGVSGRLWLVTRGTQAVGAERPLLQLTHAPIWGLGKVLALEHPNVGGRLVDLEATPQPGDAAWLVDEMLVDDGEEQRALRQGRRYVTRLAKTDLGTAVSVEMRAN